MNFCVLYGHNESSSSASFFVHLLRPFTQMKSCSEMKFPGVVLLESSREVDWRRSPCDTSCLLRARLTPELALAQPSLIQLCEIVRSLLMSYKGCDSRRTLKGVSIDIDHSILFIVMIISKGWGHKNERKQSRQAEARQSSTTRVNSRLAHWAPS